jgi:hypothetical protein
MDNPANRCFTDPPTTADVKVGAILSPILESHQYSLFYPDFGLGTRFGNWSPQGFEGFDHLLKRGSMDAEAPLKVFR